MVAGSSTKTLDPDQRALIEELAMDSELTPAEIHRKLLAHEHFLGGYLMSLRMTERYVKRIRGNLDPILDQIFQWDLLEAAQLPWEASSFLLDMWAYDQDFNAQFESHLSVAGGATRYQATMRKAKWWWKVHLAVPELPEYSAVNNLPLDRHDFIWRHAEIFWLADFSTSVLGNPIDTSGQWAHLAYKPWEAPNLERYNRAVREGRIKPMIKGLSRWTDEDGGISTITDQNPMERA